MDRIEQKGERKIKKLKRTLAKLKANTQLTQDEKERLTLLWEGELHTEEESLYQYRLEKNTV